MSTPILKSILFNMIYLFSDYRKYLKYKHKKIKILKKKLKWKRIFQKVLQKHINFADKIVPY